MAALRGIFYGSDPHENFTENMSKIDTRSGFVSHIKCSKSPGLRGFALDPTRKLTALPRPAARGKRNIPKNPPLSARASLFGPSGFAISVNPYNIVDSLAPMSGGARLPNVFDVSSPHKRQQTLNIRCFPDGYIHKLEMWANAQRDGRPAEYRWRPLFNAEKFG